MKFVAALVFTLCCAVTTAEESEIVAKRLTARTFEHLTQSASGATTGDWFVMFFAPWCTFCQQLHPTWDQLAAELDKEVNIATVDATAEKDLAKRFKIKGYPTLVLFSKGKMFVYSSGSRDIQSLKVFAVGGFEENSGEPVPPEPSLADFIHEQLGFLKSDFHLILLQAKFAGGIVIAVSFLFGFVLRGCFSSTAEPTPAAGDKKSQ